MLKNFKNTFTIKYLLKIPPVPLWPREKVEKFTYCKFKEYIDKSKVLYRLSNPNPLLEQYFMYDQLYTFSKPILFLSALYSIKSIFNRKLSIPKRVIYPFLYMVPSGLLSLTLASFKNIFHLEYLKKDLLKTKNNKEVDDYITYSNYFSNI